jgi:hypothetical protein
MLRLQGLLGICTLLEIEWYGKAGSALGAAREEAEEAAAAAAATSAAKAGAEY